MYQPYLCPVIYAVHPSNSHLLVFDRSKAVPIWPGYEGECLISGNMLKWIGHSGLGARH